MGDSAVLLRYEQTQRPPEMQWQAWKDRAVARIMSGVQDIESKWAKTLPDVTAASVALACVLSYIDFRHPTLDWRAEHPALSRFHAEFSKRESMLAWPLA